MNAEIAMNTTMKTLIRITCFFSLIFLMMLPLSRSIVSVELEAITSDDSVLIEADRTKITTIAIRKSGRVESIVGIIESKPPAGTPSFIGISAEKSLPKPPRK